MSFLKKLIIQVAENGQKVEASGININIGGIGFYSKKFFQKGSRISIQVCLDNKLHQNAVWINAVVVWSRIEQDGAVTGAQFDNIIKFENYPELYKVIYKQSI